MNQTTRIKVTGVMADRHTYVVGRSVTTKIISKIAKLDGSGLPVCMEFDTSRVVGEVIRFYLNEKSEVCVEMEVALTKDILDEFTLFAEPAIVMRGEAMLVPLVGLNRIPSNKFLSPIAIVND